MPIGKHAAFALTTDMADETHTEDYAGMITNMVKATDMPNKATPITMKMKRIVTAISMPSKVSNVYIPRVGPHRGDAVKSFPESYT